MPGYIKELRALIGSRPIITAGSGVIIVKENQILLQHRIDNDCWGIPGGMMEPGEELQDTAIREAYEETGLRVWDLKLFDVFSGPTLYYQYPNGDEVYNVATVYFTNQFSGQIVSDGVETQAVKFFALQGIPSLEKISPPDRPIIQAVQARFDWIKRSLGKKC